ncbi:MAG: hypothetical protein JF606_19815 [Burkholderiales bacterium]|jgi:hypothetical protein|nr:hypothetical protein [Burkholderiales bacterium]
MSKIASWRTLLRIKERKIKKQEEVIQRSREELAACEASLDAANQELQRESEHRDTFKFALRDAMTGTKTFRPDFVTTLRYHIDDGDRKVEKAQSIVTSEEVQVVSAKDALQAEQMLLTRLEHQKKTMQEQLDKAIQARENEIEDTQDEDAEETAVARLVAAAAADKGDSDARWT